MNYFVLGLPFENLVRELHSALSLMVITVLLEELTKVFYYTSDTHRPA